MAIFTENTKNDMNSNSCQRR